MVNGTSGNGVGASRDTWIIVCTIIATGIGIAVIVGTLVGYQIAHVRQEISTHENRVDDLRRSVSIEIQDHLNDIRRDTSRHMDEIKNELMEIKENLQQRRGDNPGEG